jgi:hypothetical protein
MARFAVGRPVTTSEPVVTVDAGLKAGAHRFQLVVTTADGRESKPDVVTVTVVEGRTPTDLVIPRE